MYDYMIFFHCTSKWAAKTKKPSVDWFKSGLMLTKVCMLYAQYTYSKSVCCCGLDGSSSHIVLLWRDVRTLHFLWWKRSGSVQQWRENA